MKMEKEIYENLAREQKKYFCGLIDIDKIAFEEKINA